MHTKTKVMNIYPKAVVIVDTHYYGPIVESDLSFLLVQELPTRLKEKAKNGKIFLDFHNTPDRIQLRALSTWCQTEKDCWLDAWDRLQRKVAARLDE